MQLLIVLSAVAAVALARPGLITPIQHQYHAQDELGQYTYGYSGGPSAKVESRTADGVTRGAYSYVDSNGLLQSVNYQADPVNGFRVAATNLPVAPAPVAGVVAPVAPVAAPIAVAPAPVVDTPEVAAAKAEHLAVKAAADAAVVGAVAVAAPVPVVETPEVAAEKARHLAAVANARATIIDDSAISDDGSYKVHPLEEDGSYRGEPSEVVVAQSPVGPVAAVVSTDTSALHDDGSYKINPFVDDGSYKINPLEDDGSYKGEVAVVGTRLVNTIAPVNAHHVVSHPIAYAPAVTRYAVTAPAINTVAYSAVAPAVIPAVAPIHSQYHAQDELGQYSYGYAGGLSAKHESKTADGITRGGYSYIDANGIVQSVHYVSDPVNGFRVSATNLPVAPQ